MFNLSGSEIVFILLLALVILGPEKLPEALRTFGRTYGELKKMSSGFQSEFKQALDEPMRELRGTADALRQAANFDAAADLLEGRPPATKAAPGAADGEESVPAQSPTAPATARAAADDPFAARAADTVPAGSAEATQDTATDAPRDASSASASSGTPALFDAAATLDASAGPATVAEPPDPVGLGDAHEPGTRPR